MNRELKRARGVYYTPERAARWMAEEVLRHFAASERARLRVLDPACGDGVFLRAAAAAGVALENLHGIDLDGAALAVARRSLPGARLVEADALIRFPWTGAFAAPFDVVLGNPPYVRPHRLPARDKLYLRQNYAAFEKKADLYVCFVERALERLREGGRLAYLTSRGWLTHDSFQKLRELLLERFACETLVECPDDLFDGADVRTLILTGARKAAPPTAPAPPIRVGRLEDGESGVVFRGAIDPVDLGAGYKSVFDLSLADPAAARTRRTIAARGRPLGEGFEICFGLKTGDDDKWLRPLSRPTGALDRPLVTGEDVSRWRIAPPRLSVRYDPKAMRAHRATARPGEPARFERPKLLVKDTSPLLAAALDLEGRYAKDVLLVSPRGGHSLLYLLGILNSSLMTFYYRGTFNTIHVQKNELVALPALVDGSPSLMAEIERLAAARAQAELDRAVCALYGVSMESIV